MELIHPVARCVCHTLGDDGRSRRLFEQRLLLFDQGYAHGRHERGGAFSLHGPVDCCVGGLCDLGRYAQPAGLVRHAVAGRRGHIDAQAPSTTRLRERALENFGIYFAAGQCVVAIARHVVLVDGLVQARQGLGRQFDSERAHVVFQMGNA